MFKIGNWNIILFMLKVASYHISPPFLEFSKFQHVYSLVCTSTICRHKSAQELFWYNRFEYTHVKLMKISNCAQILIIIKVVVKQYNLKVWYQFHPTNTYQLVYFPYQFLWHKFFDMVIPQKNFYINQS